MTSLVLPALLFAASAAAVAQVSSAPASTPKGDVPRPVAPPPAIAGPEALEREWARPGVWTTIPLISDASHTFLLVEAEINGKRCRLMVDTGAAMTVLSADGAERLGLKVEAAEGETLGVGGATRKRKAAVPAWTLGTLPLPARAWTVLPLDGLNHAASWGGEAPVGVLGSDILDRQHLILDVVGRRLLRANEGTVPNQMAAAIAAGYLSGPLDRKCLLPVIDLNLGKTRARALIDTGARTLVADEKLATELGLPTLPGFGTLSGSGGRIAPPTVVFKAFDFGPTRFRYAGANTMDLSVFPERIRLIMGVDMQHACDLIFDYRARCVYFKKGAIDATELGVGGPLAYSKEQLVELFAGCRTIAQGTPTGWGIVGEAPDAAGVTRLKVAVTYRLDAMLAGEGAPGESVVVTVLVPKSDTALADLRARATASQFNLILRPKSDAPAPIEEVLRKLSAARLGQIRSLAPKATPAPKS